MKRTAGLAIALTLAFFFGYALGGSDARIMHPCSDSKPAKESSGDPH